MSRSELKEVVEGNEYLEKTVIIISNLSRDDFLKDRNSTMSYTDRIKLAILNLDNPRDVAYEGEQYYLNSISDWSALPTMNRLIIIMKNEDAARRLYNHLSSDNEFKFAEKNVKLTLQENFLKRSKSFDSISEDNSLSVEKSLSKFRDYHNDKASEYLEPEPKAFDAITDLSMLGIDIGNYNTKEQLNNLQQEPGMKRSKSLTKTLFKPDLKISTNLKTQSKTDESPTSPTITLDDA